MRLIHTALGMLLTVVVPLGAQTKDVNDGGKRKIEVEDGKKITVVGCLVRNPGGGFMLLNESGDLQYDLVTNKDLSTQVGDRVEVRGKATDLGDAKLKIEAEAGNATITTEYKGTLGLKYLGVDQVKTVSPACQVN